jgi:hypothetical protein
MTGLVKFLQALIAKISDRGAKGRHDPISGGYWQADLWQQNDNSATTRPALFGADRGTSVAYKTGARSLG